MSHIVEQHHAAASFAALAVRSERRFSQVEADTVRHGLTEKPLRRRNSPMRSRSTVSQERPNFASSSFPPHRHHRRGNDDEVDAPAQQSLAQLAPPRRFAETRHLWRSVGLATAGAALRGAAGTGKRRAECRPGTVPGADRCRRRWLIAMRGQRSAIDRRTRRHAGYA
jgi:hypothetical protein